MACRPQALGRIFRPFEQAGDSVQRAKGTGLGLAITQELVYAMNGALHVDSKVGAGSTFTFVAEFPAMWTPSTQEDVGTVPEARVALRHVNGVTAKAKTASVVTTTVDAIMPPAQQELALLLDMAQKGELPNLQRQVEQLASEEPTIQPFADQVSQLIRNYEEEKLVTLLADYQQS